MPYVTFAEKFILHTHTQREIVFFSRLCCGCFLVWLSCITHTYTSRRTYTFAGRIEDKCILFPSRALDTFLSYLKFCQNRTPCAKVSTKSYLKTSPIKSSRASVESVVIKIKYPLNSPKQVDKFVLYIIDVFGYSHCLRLCVCIRVSSTSAVLHPPKSYLERSVKKRDPPVNRIPPPAYLSTEIQ